MGPREPGNPVERTPSGGVPVMTRGAHGLDAGQKPAQPACFVGLEPQGGMEGRRVGFPVRRWVTRLSVASSG